jgi:hypothetical protein
MVVVMMTIKWKIYGWDGEEWRHFNNFTGSETEAKAKAADIMIRTRYLGVRLDLN